MTGIVEHVARAIFDGGVILPGETSQTAQARAAIRATLEYARDNVEYKSAERVHKLLACWDLSVADVAEGLELYLSALLAELDGKESEGR